MKFKFRERTVFNSRVLAIVAVLCFIGLFSGCNFERAEASQKMKEALQEYNSGSTTDAIKELKEAHELDPTWAKPALNLAQIYHDKLGEYENAERYYREAMSRDPDNKVIPYKLGKVLADMGRHDEAASVLTTAVQNHPDYAKAWFRLGESQVALGKYPDAVDSFMKSINASPRMKIGDGDPGGAAYHALGDVYLRFDFNDKALKVYENGIENNPDAPRLYHGQGLAQLKLERYQQAAESLRKALELKENYASASFNLAIAQNAMGQREEAIQRLERFLARAEDQARIVAAQGLLQKLKQQKKKEESEQAE
jgi:tetratricopeptide (TPR) repeat protein